MKSRGMTVIQDWRAARGEPIYLDSEIRVHPLEYVEWAAVDDPHHALDVLQDVLEEMIWRSPTPNLYGAYYASEIKQIGRNTETIRVLGEILGHPDPLEMIQ